MDSARRNGTFGLWLAGHVVGCSLGLLSCSQGDVQEGFFEVPKTSDGLTSTQSSSETNAAKGPEVTSDTALPLPETSFQTNDTTSAVGGNDDPQNVSRCDDGVRNGKESDVDCGGPVCPACVAKKVCNTSSDCASKVCAAGRCMTATCKDGVRNGSESDIDCGGDCEACGGGAACRLGRDCRSNVCLRGRCTPEGCSKDEDCAHLGDVCNIGKCNLERYECVRRPSNEGVSCDSGRACVDNEVCTQGQCQGGTPRDCSALQDECTAAYCDKSTDRCQPQSLIRWHETFQGITASNTRGWRSNGNSVWRIGAAKASVSCHQAQDPALDHSADDSNMLLGSMIGDCVRGKVEALDCVFGPSIDLRNAPQDMQLRFWRHLQTQDSSIMQHLVRVRTADGTWDTVISGFANAIWDRTWVPITIPVEHYRHKEFAVSICMVHTRDALLRLPVAGWSLDDFSLAPQACSAKL